MNIWILESSSGKRIFFKSFLKISVDGDIVSGLLSAFNQFLKVEFHQPIESIEMGGLRWVYIDESTLDLLFVAADTKNVPAEVLHDRLKIIKDSFIRTYSNVLHKRGKVFAGNLVIFESFNDVIDDFYVQWGEAELMENLADFFDLLGVFQQILNFLNEISIKFLEIETNKYIYNELEKIYRAFINNNDIKDDNEIQKIVIDREKGINIIRINAFNCDPYFVKYHLINFIRKIIITYKEILGLDISHQYFRKVKIFEYLMKKRILLKQLNIEYFFLDLFLLA